MGIWAPNGRQIDAMALPNGSFISPTMTRMRIQMVQNNPEYRESLEKASRIAGYTDPALSLSRGRVSGENERALFKQNEKAERLIKEKENVSGIVTGSDID